MVNRRITPAELVISAFQGVRPAARALGVDPSAVCRWQEIGDIPSKYQKRILMVAWQNEIDLTAHDLIFGRPE